MKYSYTKLLAGEVTVDFHVLTNEANSLNNTAISTFLHSLPLACPVLTWSTTLMYISQHITDSTAFIFSKNKQRNTKFLSFFKQDRNNWLSYGHILLTGLVVHSYNFVLWCKRALTNLLSFKKYILITKLIMGKCNFCSHLEEIVFIPAVQSFPKSIPTLKF